MLNRFRKSLHRAFTIVCVLISAIGSHVVQASTWLEAGDERARHHLQILADAGEINIPLTTWPLNLTDVENALAAVDQTQLSDPELRSFTSLKQLIGRKSTPVQAGQSLYVNSTMPGFIDFGTDFRERLESRTYVAVNHGRWSGKAQLSVVGQDIDGQTWRGDGSYIARDLGNWQLGFGAVDQWWGPGWQSSIILSNAARPSAGFFVNRIESTPFRWPVLEWLGPWSVRVFANELESDRPSSKAKLLGFRTSFKPHPKVEFGLSRSAQWGGEGRPENWLSLRKTLIGRTNRGSDGNAADGSDEPANQLAGYDWRINHTIGRFPTAFYGQIIGEDEAHSQPYKFLGLAGLETVIYSADAQHRFMFEASNTTMEFYKYEGGTPNVGYESPTHPAGYRHRSRPIGASTDNDTENYVVKGLHDFGKYGVNWSLGRAIVNADGGNLSGAGGNVYAESRVATWHATIGYRIALDDRQQLEIGGQYFENSLQLRDQDIGSGIHATYHYWF